ncbi:MAG: choice-of-anchor J domain-containing protein [Candidatus Delongbacteria bacterium]|nr:choice-of-anchor J domain-containing protein [Candidatus Delongbacteria bacterium]MBN2834291.1 choice-of-anchor J domain-containing protein [Candidatus Delongbacteria bacterium]
MVYFYKFLLIVIPIIFITCTSGVQPEETEAIVYVKIEEIPQIQNFKKCWLIIIKDDDVKEYVSIDEIFSGASIQLHHNNENFTLLLIATDNSTWTPSSGNEYPYNSFFATKHNLIESEQRLKVISWHSGYFIDGIDLGIITNLETNIQNITFESAYDLNSFGDYINGTIDVLDEYRWYRVWIDIDFDYYFHIDDRLNMPSEYTSESRGLVCDSLGNILITDPMSSNSLTGTVKLDNYSGFAYVKVYSVDNMRGSFGLRLISSEKDAVLPPICTITSPLPNDFFNPGDIVIIKSEAWSPNNSVSLVRFFINGILLYTDTSYPYKFLWDTNELEEGEYNIKIIAVDVDGVTSSSQYCSVFISSQSATIFYEGFENGIPDNWFNIDFDGDSFKWEVNDDVTGYNNSNGAAASYSWNIQNGELTPDNYLITPSINITGKTKLCYHVCAQDKNWSNEHYAVLLSTNGTNLENFNTILYEETLSNKEQGEWKERVIVLDESISGSVHIAFRHYNVTNQFALVIDNVELIRE